VAGVPLASGRYEIAVEKAGHDPWQEAVELGEGEVREIVATLRPLLAKLVVLTLHENRGTWATILVDDVVVGEAHTVKHELPAGEHDFCLATFALCLLPWGVVHREVSTRDTHV
jgi:hypothetical protein